MFFNSFVKKGREKREGGPGQMIIILGDVHTLVCHYELNKTKMEKNRPNYESIYSNL